MLKLEDVVTQNNLKGKILIGNASFDSNFIKVFDKRVINFLDYLSRIIIKQKNIRKYPSLFYAGYWLRKSNINKILSNYSSEEFFSPRGNVLHITPGNIPSIFIFSLVFGILTGNKNFVKISSINFEEDKIFIDVLKKIFYKNKKFDFIKSLITILRYDKKDDNITKILFEKCDTRVIWGSDETIKNLRKFNVPPNSNELIFPDRYSVSLINNSTSASKNIKNIAKNFFKDTLHYDQFVCSSPHLIYWLGDKNNKLKKKFWEEFRNIIKSDYRLSEKMVLLKHDKLTLDLMEKKNIISFYKFNNELYLINLDSKKSISGKLSSYKGQFGMFYQKNINYLSDLIVDSDRKVQTLTYAGLSQDSLKSLFNKKSIRGIDRVVPIGEALEFSHIWDGMDLIRYLTKVRFIN